MHRLSFKLCILTIVLILCGHSTFADEFSRQQVSKPRLLHKILKNSSPLKEKIKDDKFDEKLLKSSFSSWGIDPGNNTSSINLLPVWKTFKKEKKKSS